MRSKVYVNAKMDGEHWIAIRNYAKMNVAAMECAIPKLESVTVMKVFV